MWWLWCIGCQIVRDNTELQRSQSVRGRSRPTIHEINLCAYADPTANQPLLDDCIMKDKKIVIRTTIAKQFHYSQGSMKGKSKGKAPIINPEAANKIQIWQDDSEILDPSYLGLPESSHNTGSNSSNISNDGSRGQDGHPEVVVVILKRSVHSLARQSSCTSCRIKTSAPKQNLKSRHEREILPYNRESKGDATHGRQEQDHGGSWRIN